MGKLRVLGVIRLSSLTEDTTSPERQREAIEGTVKAVDGEIIGWAVDLGVSAAVAPWDRPELGPWLRGERERFDLAISWKLDRLVRRAVHFHGLVEMADKDGWAFKCAADPIDLTDRWGRVLAGIIAMLAEGELEAIKERTQGTRAMLRSKGRWAGGQVPYGYIPERQKAGEGWKLIIDPEQHEIMLEIVDRVLSGTSLNVIADDLTARGVPAPADSKRLRKGKKSTGAPWRVSALGDMLRSPAILGRVIQSHTVIGDDGVARRVDREYLDDDGRTVQRGPELITEETHEAIIRKLNESTPERGPRQVGLSLLTGIATCEGCGSGMQRGYSGPKSRRMHTYRCQNPRKATDGKHSVVSAARADEVVETKFLAALGRSPYLVMINDPGEDHSSSIVAVEARLDRLESDRDAGVYDNRPEAFRRRHGDLMIEMDRLRALPTRPAGYREVATGRTFAEEWKRRGTSGRRELLQSAHAHVVIAPSGEHSRHWNPDRIIMDIGRPQSMVEVGAMVAEESRHWA